MPLVCSSYWDYFIPVRTLLKLKLFCLLQSTAFHVIYLGSRTRPSAVPSIGDDAYYQPYDVYTCPKCDKVYKSDRDLAIHRSYCFGGM